MSEDNQNKEVPLEKFTQLLEDRLSSVTNIIKATEAKMTSSVEDLKNKIESPKQKESDDTDDLWNTKDSDDDDVADDKMTRYVERKAEEIERKVDERLDRRERVLAERSKYSSMAFDSYPELHDENSKFGKATAQEMDQIIQEQIETYGLKQSPEQIRQNDPRLLFTAAARVAMKHPEYRDKALVENIKKQIGKQNAGYGFNPNPPKSEGPTRDQILLANRLGLGLDKLKKYVKND